MKNNKQRNFNIMRLRGILPSIIKLIPADIAKRLEPVDLQCYREMSEAIINLIDEARIKRFTCSSCNTIKMDAKQTKNKKAHRCDYCNNYLENLFNVSAIIESKWIETI